MVKLCIMYLADSLRSHMFPSFVKHISQCKYINDIDILVLTQDFNGRFYDSILKETPLRYKIGEIYPEGNYLRKIAITLDYVKQQNIPYIMKHDNDILMSNHLYDYIYENLEVLENPSNIVLTPTLTSGIPTCDTFIEDYCTQGEKETLGKLFLEYEHGSIWGTDYSELNKFTKQATTWDSTAYYAGVKERTHHYKGIHPVRMSKDAIMKLNEYVVKYKDRIFSKENYSLTYDTTSPYFCNSIYCIKASVYETLLSHQELYVDNYDEVPLNKWRDMFNLNLVIIKNGVAVHPYYNTIDGYLMFEKDLLSNM